MTKLLLILLPALLLTATPALAQDYSGPPPDVCQQDDLSDQDFEALHCDDYAWPDDSTDPAATDDQDDQDDQDDATSDEDDPVVVVLPHASTTPRSSVVVVMPGVRVRITGGRRERGRAGVVTQRVMRGARRDRDWLIVRLRSGKRLRVQRFNVKPAQ